jgi:hypothetical protein
MIRSGKTSATDTIDEIPDFFSSLVTHFWQRLFLYGKKADQTTAARPGEKTNDVGDSRAPLADPANLVLDRNLQDGKRFA